MNNKFLKQLKNQDEAMFINTLSLFSLLILQKDLKKLLGV